MTVSVGKSTVQCVSIFADEAANADISLPAGNPPIGEILAAQAITLTEGTPNTLGSQALTVTESGSLSSNEISKEDTYTIQTGNDYSSGSGALIVLTYRAK